MRILYDCSKPEYCTACGTLTAGKSAWVHLAVPTSCRTQEVSVIFRNDRTQEDLSFPLTLQSQAEDYDRFGGEITFTQADLYFYHFLLRTRNETFRLFRYGLRDTNMEAGDPWQFSVLPSDYATPKWAQGAVLYQIFPDRFAIGDPCDCREKLQPYTLHASTEELPQWAPDCHGEILNNDFFGGNLDGIRRKLPYLQSLGVTLLYLNPIFLAYSSHRYDTADYLKIDPMLGTEEDFVRLCTESHQRNIRIILDGVFSHTGSRSTYFDRGNEFGGGAYHNPDSPYRSWYCFTEYPEKYRCWWDFLTLPTLDKSNPDYRRFVCTVAEKWLTLGADGFRLDVADELPDDFIALLRQKIKAVKPEALLIGEVWEDASHKIAYGKRRRYFTEPELDGVMNYPWKNAILTYARGEDDGTALVESLTLLAEHYPPEALACTMLPLSTHDSPRALTDLVAPLDGTREEMAAHRLTPEQRALALRRLRFAALLQFSLPGMPSIYYGDEAAVEGCKDPFNRTFFPWSHADLDLTDFFRRLAAWRNGNETLRRGSLSARLSEGEVVLTRSYEGKTTRITLSNTALTWRIFTDSDEVFL